MSKKEIIHSTLAPSAVGTYSQAVKVDNTVYLSGQIPLVPETMALVSENFLEQVHQVFKNLQLVCQAAGGDLENIVKLNLYLTDMANFPEVNEAMASYFSEPYPARAAVGVKQLPRNAKFEADGVMII